MRLEVLVKEISDAVYEKIRATRDENEISDAEAAEISKTVGLAALKYGDLSNQASKDYIFDTERFTSFEGNTGPYILYTIVRIGSILKKYAKKTGISGDDTEKTDIDGKLMEAVLKENEDARALALVLTRYNEAVTTAWTQLAPHKLCQYIYELSNAFNGFYHNVKILGEENEEKQKAYIALLTLTKKVLNNSINMLGFSAPAKM